MNATVNVELQVACASETIPGEDEIRGWIEDAIRQSGDSSPGREAREFDVVVRVVDERESRALNYRFRQKDKATNVLAFPAAGDADVPALPEQGETALGDLAICAPVLEREAREQGKTPAAHWGHLLVHGTLHLLGYDHRSEGEAEQMESLETGILAARGIGDPYS